MKQTFASIKKDLQQSQLQVEMLRARQKTCVSRTKLYTLTILGLITGVIVGVNFI